MEDTQVQGQRSAGRGPALAVLCVIAACLHPAAARAEMPASPKRGAGPKGAAGPVIEFDEAAGGRILYRDEKGGILAPIAPAIPGSRRDGLPPLAPAAGSPAGSAAASSASPRKAAPVGAAGKP